MKTDTAQQPSPQQLLELSNTVGVEVCNYVVEGGATKDQVQQYMIGQRTMVKQIAREIAHRYLKLASEANDEAKKLLEKFFVEVFDLKLDLSKKLFPARGAFNTFMASPPELDEDQIMEAYKKKWGINLYRWMEPAASKIDRKSEQKRPSGLYVFAHRGGDEPDQTHLGKSYDDAKGEKMIFMNSKEYLLATGFHRFTKEHFMDVKGWTRTSDLWSEGRLVIGYWDSDGSELNLDDGYRARRDPGDGPRELVLA